MNKHWKAGLMTMLAIAVLGLSGCVGMGEGGLPRTVEVYSKLAQGEAKYGIFDESQVCEYEARVDFGELKSLTMITRDGRQFVSKMIDTRPNLRVGQVNVDGGQSCASALREIVVQNVQTGEITMYSCEPRMDITTTCRKKGVEK